MLQRDALFLATCDAQRRGTRGSENGLARRYQQGSLRLDSNCGCGRVTFLPAAHLVPPVPALFQTLCDAGKYVFRGGRLLPTSYDCYMAMEYCDQVE